MTSRAQTVFLCFVAENGYRVYASDLRGARLVRPTVGSFGSTHLGIRQMTFVLVGAGPTGVELAASMAQMVGVAAWQFSTHQSVEKHHHPARRQSRSSELR
jgi:hypothetical protein